MAKHKKAKSAKTSVKPKIQQKQNPNMKGSLRIPSYVFYLLVFALGFLQYANTLNHGFAFDDHLILLDNQYTQRGSDALEDIFTKRVYTPERNVYRPITQATFALEVQFFVPKINETLKQDGVPKTFLELSPSERRNTLTNIRKKFFFKEWSLANFMHLNNMLIVAFTALLLFHVLVRLFPQKSIWYPFLITLLFTFHPLHVETIANIKGRDELLGFFFGLLTLLAVVHAVDKKQWLFLILGVLSFIASILCKFNAITLAPIFILSVFYVMKDTTRFIPFLLLGLIGLLAAVGIGFNDVKLFLPAAIPAFFYLFFYWKPEESVMNRALVAVAPLIFAGGFFLQSMIVMGLAVVPIAAYVGMSFKEMNTSKASIKPWMYWVPVLVAIPVLAYIYSPDFKPVRDSLEPQLNTDNLTIFSYLNNSLLNEPGVHPVTPSQKYATIVYIMGEYLKLFIFPHPLVHMYGYNQIPLASWGNLQVIVAILLYVLGIGYASYKFFYKQERDPIAFGIIFYLVTISIYTHLIQDAPDTMANRYMYMPSLGLSIVLVTVLEKLLRVSLNKEAFKLKQSLTLLGVVAVISIAFFLKSWDRNMAWEDDWALVTSDIEDMPNNAMAWGNYAHIMTLHHSNTYPDFMENPKYQQEVLGAFQQTVDLAPQYPPSHYLYGRAALAMNRFDIAEREFLKTVELEPENPKAHQHMGMLYVRKGDYVRSFQNDTERALANYRKAVPYLEKGNIGDPTHLDTYLYLAQSNFFLGNYEQTLSYAQEGLAQDPNISVFYSIMALAHANLEQYQPAIKAAEQALQLDPNDQQARMLLAQIYAGLGDMEKSQMYR